MSPGCTDEQYDTPLSALVAPNGYKGFGARIYKWGGHRHMTLGGHKVAVAAGIDVGKVNLEVSVSEGPVVRFANTTEDIADLLKYLEARGTKIAV